MNPNIVWVELDWVDFAEGTPVKWLNPRKPVLAGDVSNSFEPVPKKKHLKAIFKEDASHGSQIPP